MPRRKLQAGEATAKIEFKLPASMKALAIEAAEVDDDGDVATLMRKLLRAELRRLGLMPVVGGAPTPPRKRKPTAR